MNSDLNSDLDFGQFCVRLAEILVRSSFVFYRLIWLNDWWTFYPILVASTAWMQSHHRILGWTLFAAAMIFSSSLPLLWCGDLWRRYGSSDRSVGWSGTRSWWQGFPWRRRLTDPTPTLPTGLQRSLILRHILWHHYIFDEYNFIL